MGVTVHYFQRVFEGISFDSAVKGTIRDFSIWAIAASGWQATCLWITSGLLQVRHRTEASGGPVVLFREHLPKEFLFRIGLGVQIFVAINCLFTAVVLRYLVDALKILLEVVCIVQS